MGDLDCWIEHPYSNLPLAQGSCWSEKVLQVTLAWQFHSSPRELSNQLMLVEWQLDRFHAVITNTGCTNLCPCPSFSQRFRKISVHDFGFRHLILF